MHSRRIVGRIAVFLALIGGAISVSDPSLASATQIRCGGHDCSTLWVRCRGVDDCSVGIFGEGFEGPFNVAVTHIREALRINPDYSEARRNLQVIEQQLLP